MDIGLIWSFGGTDFRRLTAATQIDRLGRCNDSQTMHLRPHLAHHDVIDQLPVLTETAQVTDVTPLDQERSTEVAAAVAELLQTHGYQEMSERHDVEALTEFLHTELENKSLGRRLRILLGRYDRAFPSLLRIRIQTDDEVVFVPGQYIAINYEGIPRAYSLTSQPHQSELEICVRRVPTGRLTPRLATDLNVGDPITVRGPYGELALQSKSNRDLVFLATGTGVAPFKSMIEYALQTGWDEHEGQLRDVWLFLGAAWKDDLPYRDEFRTLANTHDNFHFVPTLSRESALTDWDGETAYVQQTLLKYLDESTIPADARSAELDRFLAEEPQTGIQARLIPENMEVYACGINAMVYSLVTTIKQIGVSEEYIQLEGYG